VKKTHVRHVRLIPKVKIPNELADKLHEIAFRAYKRAHKKLAGEALQEKNSFLHTATALAVEHAIRHYISEKTYEISPPDFRQMVKTEGRGESPVARAVKKLQDSIHGLTTVLPNENPPSPDLAQALEAAPFEQMRSLFCYEDTEVDGLDDDADETDEREAIWDNRLSPAAVRETLEQWLSLMDTLHRRAGMGAAPASAKADFVRELAAFWTNEIGGRLGSSRKEAPNKEKIYRRDQQGPFAEFVHAAAEGIPVGFPRTSWDDAIRRVSEGTY
jgi:hypothetical protein